MTLKEIYMKMDQIGCLTFSTVENGLVHSRIAHFFTFDHEGLYFRTMDSKPFYQQLKQNKQITVCGMYPSTQLLHQTPDSPPVFPAGFTIRLMGEARELLLEEVFYKAESNPEFNTAVYDIKKYPCTRVFCIDKAKGEIFDFDFEMEHRNHKLLRERFAFGGMRVNKSGCRITSECIACGQCVKACTFEAIEEGKPFKINGSKCDECGSCMLVCPVKAIEKPLTI